MKNQKILFICAASKDVMNFRRHLILALLDANYEVSVIAFDKQRASDIEALGATFYCVEDENRSVNPLRVLSLTKRYRKIIKQVQPNVVFTFALKPNTFGVLAAKKEKVENIFSMVEGAGDVFINNTFKWRIIRRVVCRLYKKAFKNSKKVFFLNEDDKAEFIARGLVLPTQCEIVHGIGVDLEKFAFKPVVNDRTFLMVARMLKTKGIFEYCECARLVKQKYPDAVFNYLGAEGTVKVADIQEYIDDGSICYLGTTTDVRRYFEDCVCNVLPSYREGFGLVIAEAGAVGRLSIAGNTIGTKDAIKHNYSGFLVGIKSAKFLAEQCLWVIEHFNEAKQMGENARKFAEENFDAKVINAYILNTIRDFEE